MNFITALLDNAKATEQVIPARWLSFFLVSVFLDNQVAASAALAVGDILQQLIQPAVQRFTDAVQLIQRHPIGNFKVGR